MTLNAASHLGPDIQSIISLTTLRRQLVKYMPNYIIKYTEIFCWKNVRIFCKRFSHFSNKKYLCICNIYILNFKVMLTNDVVNFEQLAPGLYCLPMPHKKEVRLMWVKALTNSLQKFQL